MQLTHKIALKPTPFQQTYFKKAAGTSRFVWNWGLAKWKEEYALGQKPNAMALKKSFNAIKYIKYPWLHEIHRDCHAQPFAYLGKAWNKFFNEIKHKKSAHEPKFKKKHRSRDAFYIANDKFSLDEKQIRLPKIGWIKMTESLRFTGKILGATVSRTANRWYVAIQVDIPDYEAKKSRTGHEILGVDFGIKAAVTISSGESILSPKPLKSALRRLKIRSRSLSRKIKTKKEKIYISNNRKKSSLKLAKLHARIVNLRADFTHKLTTRLIRENQAVVIEDLNVAGMLKNKKLSRAISDIGFGSLRRQLEYKSLRYDTTLIIADRWYPSSKLCSNCGFKKDSLTLKERTWKCHICGSVHDRDINAALNLKRLATKTALPVASHLVTNGTNQKIIFV